MRLNYVTLGSNNTPAYRYRIKIPGSLIGEGRTTVIPVEADVHIFTKPYTEDSMILRSYMRLAENMDYVFDICDNLFDRRIEGPYIRHMIKNASVVTTSTDEMSRVVKDETGIDSVVIGDPYEFPQSKPKDVSVKKPLWFGTQGNLPLLRKIRTKHRVEIVCKKDDGVKRILDKLEFSFKFTEWSLENMARAFNRNNVVIIPGDDSQKRAVKSPNRVFESIRQGLAVVAYPLPEYRQFEKYITLTENIDEDIDNAFSITKEAQSYVENKFSPQKIAKEWEKVFRKVMYG